LRHARQRCDGRELPLAPAYASGCVIACSVKTDVAVASREKTAQLSLFGEAPSYPATSRASTKTIDPAVVEEDTVRVAARVSRQLRLGTSSWSFPGWQHIVYARKHSENALARGGLEAYARHPLLRCVGIDRTYYRPVDANVFRAYADVVDSEFRFVVKAHEDVVLPRFSNHPRYGARKGGENPRYLDPMYAVEAVVAPAVEGLAGKLGPIVFQFSPDRSRGDDAPARFAARLHRFLEGLPRGPVYAVEIRTAAYLGADYAAALRDGGAVHCLTVHPSMPSIAEQWARVTLEDGAAMVVRWMLGGRLEYEEAKDRYAPFDRLVDEDPPTRGEIADLALAAALRNIPIYVVANNKAEGSAPLTLIALAREIAARG
jgi:uncharacterized protein YecE (DUF72 family)